VGGLREVHLPVAQAAEQCHVHGGGAASRAAAAQDQVARLLPVSAARRKCPGFGLLGRG